MLVVLSRNLQPCRCVCKKALVRHKASFAPAFQLDEDKLFGLPSQLSSTEEAFCPVLPNIRSREQDMNEHRFDTCPFTAGNELKKLQTETSQDGAVGAMSFEDIPGPKGFPFVGNALKYTKFGPYSFEKILDNRFSYLDKYGTIYKERLGTMWIVQLFEPKDIAKMFRLEGKHPSRGTIANLELTYLKRNNKLIGFAFQDGPEWARQRGKIQKLMMHPTAATRYLHWQNPVARDFADYLGEKRDPCDIVPNLYEDLFKYTMESIGAVCFGERLGAFGDNPTNDAKALSSAIAETFFCFRNCMFSYPWYQHFRTPMYKRFENASNTMREIMGRHVTTVEKRLRNSIAIHEGGCPFSTNVNEEGRSVFEVLISDDGVSQELAVNLIMALLRTGIDSTANALAFFLYNLANNPDKQDNVFKEISEVLPDNASVTSESLHQMPYLKAALRESFRLNFPVFGGSGRTMPEDMEFSGYMVPKGTFIFANMATMSLMPEYFPKPLEFHPERWLRDERGSMRTEVSEEAGFLSLPFSHGLRGCPGKRFAEQGLYLAIVAILQKYKLSYSKGEMGMIHMPFTTPDKPLDIEFTPRP